MRYATVVVIFVFLLALSHSESLAQISSTIHGTVRLAVSGESPVIVRIRLEKYGLPIQELIPRENRFEFANVEEGRYTLVVDAPGYQSVREEITVPGDRPTIVMQPDHRLVQRAQLVPVWELRVPESARRQFEAGKSELRQNHCKNVIEHMQKAIRDYAQFGDAHLAMGDCYAQMNQLDAAEREFKLALEQPHQPELHLLLGKVYQREQNQAQMQRQLELYAEEKPNTQRSR
jgi:tetratricopeptide (TPR) repeat protein